MTDKVVINPRAHAIAASIVGDDSVMDLVADQILRIAMMKAARHRETGNYMRNLKVITAPDRNGKDRLVVADDPAAVPIEFGHILITRRGRRVKGRWVPGLHIMADAYAEVRRV